MMQWQEWLQLLGGQVRETPPLQWVAVGAGVAEVLLARANSVWLYPAGIISTALSILLLGEAKLYAESALNVYYVIMSLYGWVHWTRRKGEAPVPVAWAGRQDWLVTAGIIIGGFAVLYAVLRAFTPSDVPAWDAWVSATAWAGTWLLARRKIENWLVLNLSNLFAVPLLLYKKLPLYAGLTVFLFFVAIWGFIDWQRIHRRQLAAGNR